MEGLEAVKKKVTISILGIVVILVAGWAVYSFSASKGQSKQQATEKVVKHSSATKHVSSSSTQSSSSQSTATNQLNVDQLTPQQTVAALMYYAKENPQLHFERSWTNAFSNANVNTVYITTIDVEQLSEQGQNVRYALGSSDRDESLEVDSDYEYPSYTLDTDSTVHFYGNQEIGDNDGHQVKPDVSVSLSGPLSIK